MSPPIPTIGRIVLFVGEDGQDRPAIVTHVWSQFCVNLNVFPKDGPDTHAGIRTSVTHAGPETNEATPPGTWHWMPYQIQTVGTRHQDAPKIDANQPRTFSEALTLAKDGYAIRRLGWNGKGLLVKIQRPDVGSKMTLPYLFIEYPDGKRCPWLASQTDLLSDDWFVIPAESTVKQ